MPFDIEKLKAPLLGLNPVERANLLIRQIRDTDFLRAIYADSDCCITTWIYSHYILHLTGYEF